MMISSVSSRPLPVISQLESVQVGLVVVEQVERLGPETVDLAAQLAADRSARPGDQHPPAGDQRGGLLAHYVQLAAAEQIPDSDLAQVGKARIAFHGGQERRQEPDVQPAGPARSR